MDDPASLHDLNVLTATATERYNEFVVGSQN